MAADAELAIAAAFLAPVLQRENIIEAKGKSIVSILDPGKGDAGARDRVVCKALLIFLNIHHALDQASGESQQSDVSRNPIHRKIVDGLLDLISLEGIYPCLSSGVGVPIERRVMSVLKDGIITRTSSVEDVQEAKDKRLLVRIMADLYDVASCKTTGLVPALRERTMVDVIAGLGELAYNPVYINDISGAKHVELLEALLETVPTSTLLPTLTSLIRPTTPSWLSSHLSTFLSLLPLRSNGVQQTIGFIASTVPQEHYHSEKQSFTPDGKSRDSIFSLEILDRVSKLLVAVPSTLTAHAYFSALGPQLLQLLDGQDIGMKRAAAYIIGNGILGRRKYGSSGTVGWEVFAQPIIGAIDPERNGIRASKSPEGRGKKQGSTVIVSEPSLSRALNRLSSLLLLHPNPGLTKRLITSLLLPMWGLWCYSKEARRSKWADEIYELFCIYFKTAAGVEQFICLIDQLRWDGGILWTYGAGPDGGIEIRERLEASYEGPNVVAIVENIDRRLHEVTRLLAAQVLNDEGINTLFLHVSKHWLLGIRTVSSPKSLKMDDETIEESLLQILYAKMTQNILSKYKDKIAANPNKIMELVGQLLAAFAAENRDTELQNSKVSKPSIAGLSSLLNPETNRSLGSDSHLVTSPEESIEVVSLALNLLLTILPSSDISLTAALVDFADMRRNLSYLMTSRTLPTSLVFAATSILALLDLENPNPSSTKIEMPESLNRFEAERKSHALALTYVVDPLPPVRAQGIALLTGLVKKSSPVLDVPSSAILLLSLLQDEDEYIYLSTIQALGLLASKHPKTVVKMLVDDYIDNSESKELDVRIRVGEAILKTVKNLGGDLTGEPASLIGEGMIAMAGRRGQRVKEREAKAKRSQRYAKARKEVSDAWGGHVPSLGDEVEDEMIQGLANNVEGWEGSQGEEDVRMRASSLSILGVAIETNVAGIGPTIVSTALDLVLSILKLETINTKAILRRAAVLVIMSLIKALDTVDERGSDISPGMAGENLLEVISVLRYVEATDSDELVVGHVRVVIESLETWQSESILGMPRSILDSNPRVSVKRGQLAGLSVVPEVSIASRPSIEEIG